MLEPSEQIRQRASDLLLHALLSLSPSDLPPMFARRRHRHHHGGLRAGGVAAGLIVGAAVGAAAASTTSTTNRPRPPPSKPSIVVITPSVPVAPAAFIQKCAYCDLAAQNAFQFCPRCGGNANVPPRLLICGSCRTTLKLPAQPASKIQCSQCKSILLVPPSAPAPATITLLPTTTTLSSPIPATTTILLPAPSAPPAYNPAVIAPVRIASSNPK